MLTDHRSGTLPSKATSNLTVGFGLVQIPIALYSGTDDGAKVRRSQFTDTGDPVGNRPYNKATGEDYTGPIVKKVQLDAVTAVELTDEEVEAVTGGPVAGMATIETFIPLSEIGSTYVATSVNQVRPQRLTKAGKHFPNPGAERSFMLLCAAMAEAGVAGLVKIALRGPSRYAALTPDGQLLMLAFAQEVRADLPLPEVELLDAELALARQLIEGVGTSTPVLNDDAGVKLNEYVAAKAAGGETAKVEAFVAATEPETDLMALLASAVAAAAPKAEAPAKAKRTTKTKAA